MHPGGGVHDILTGLGLEKDLVFSDTPTDGLRLLAAGTGDYAVVALLPGLFTIKAEHLDDLRVVIRSVTSQSYSYAVRRGEDKILSVFNEGLALIKLSGRYQELRRKWFGVMDSRNISWHTAFKYTAMVLVPLLLLLGGFTAWSYSLRRVVAQRTRSLSTALEELRRNQQQLVQADKMAALGTLVSGVAHEINNPNGLILLNIPILRELINEAVHVLEETRAGKNGAQGGSGPYTRIRAHLPRILESMEESARRIKRIVDDLRDFSRMDSPAEREEILLNEIVERAARLLGPKIRKATGRFASDCAQNLPRIRGSRHRLEQVAVNLILNACEALRGPEDSITVSTRYDAERDAVVLSVRDTGRGIAADDMPRLTDPFFTTKRSEGGTGLGLSVSAGIVKEHGGDLRFVSTAGGGAEAICVLPVHPEPRA
ncbi:MAG: transporter substrate-binding domain-containing protein [Desulfovibrio sp.]|nr:transporter substrate-binding domain-containing protein [Desulfovibrio sp.]